STCPGGSCPNWANASRKCASSTSTRWRTGRGRKDMPEHTPRRGGRPMRVTVLGAGSWGSTVASLSARNAETLIWARRSETVDEINREHRNSTYLKDLPLSRRLRATADLDEALRDCDVLVMGVPSHSFRDTLRQVAGRVRPWV